MSELHREFPSDPNAERGVIASLLLAPVDVRSLLATHGVSGQSLYLPAHQLILDTCVEIVDDGCALDFITLGTRLESKGKLDAVGGPGYLHELFDFLPSAANVSWYLDTLLETAVRRRSIEIATRLANGAYDRSNSVRELVAAAHGDIGAMLQTKSKRPSIRDTMNEILAEVLNGRDDSGLIKTGMEGFDGRIELFRGDFLVISAPTSCGKSALAFQIALNCAMRGQRCALYPLEMKQKQSLKRAIAQLGGDSPEYIRRLVKSTKEQGGEPHPETVKTLDRFAATAKTVANLPVHMRDDVASFEGIRADMRTEHGKAPFTFAVVDYLQLIQTERSFERRQLAIAHFTQGFKLLAKELDCVICVPSQINKAGGTREAEDAENDASCLVKIHGEEDAKGDVHPGRVSVWKQREGARHIDLPLVFNPAFTRFDYQEHPVNEAPREHPNARRR